MHSALHKKWYWKNRCNASTVFLSPWMDINRMCDSAEASQVWVFFFSSSTNVLVWCQSRTDQRDGEAPRCAQAPRCSYMLPQQTLRSHVYLLPPQLERWGRLCQRQLYLEPHTLCSPNARSSITTTSDHTFRSPHLTSLLLIGLAC